MHIFTTIKTMWGIFMKKQMLVLVAIAAVMLAIGCVSSGNENAASQNPSSSSAASTPSGGSNQDTDWMLSATSNMNIINADQEEYYKAVNSSDYSSMAKVGQKIVDDTKKALDDNSKYTLSAKAQDAQKEWTAALQDFNSAGNYMILAANDGEAGNSSTENSQQLSSLLLSGADHLNKMSKLVDAI
jgi:hypothetical protein